MIDDEGVDAVCVGEGEQADAGPRELRRRAAADNDHRQLVGEAGREDLPQSGAAPDRRPRLAPAARPRRLAKGRLEVRLPGRGHHRPRLPERLQLLLQPRVSAGLPGQGQADPATERRARHARAAAAQARRLPVPALHGRHLHHLSCLGRGVRPPVPGGDRAALLLPRAREPGDREDRSLPARRRLLSHAARARGRRREGAQRDPAAEDDTGGDGARRAHHPRSRG